MTDIRTIKAAEGRRVRDPATGAVLPEEGQAVTWTSHWQRRLNDGDVIVLSGQAANAPSGAPIKKEA